MTLSVIRRTLAATAALALASFAAAGTAQAQDVPTGARQIRQYGAVVGINPLGVPFDIFAIEAEGVVAPGFTTAGAFSYFAPDEDRFASGDIKLRYYPGEVALDGFSIGLAAGFTRFSGLDYTQQCNPVPPSYMCDFPRNTVTGPTASVLADYNFLLGSRRRFFLGTGVGAKRFIVSKEKRESVGADRAWVFARFLVGVAF